MGGDITTMELYPRPERLLVELRARGFDDDTPLPIDTLAELDQLHYHGTDALDIAIERAAIDDTSRVLEIGSGWGGCARWIAHRTGAAVTTVEMQTGYDSIGRALTQRVGLADRVRHVNADFHEFRADDSYSHVASWLALFHIPRRSQYLCRIADALDEGGLFFAEDLYAIEPVPASEQEDFDARLFPNSLVSYPDYLAGIIDAGFEVIDVEDMTDDWTTFTGDRLVSFRADRPDFESRHDAATFAGLDRFYAGMASDFARNLVGGVRVLARKR